MRIFVFLICFSCVSSFSSASDIQSPWIDVETTSAIVRDKEYKGEKGIARRVKLDKSLFQSQLVSALDSHDSNFSFKQKERPSSSAVLLPLPDGSQIKVTFEETQVLAPALAEKFPEVKTYKVNGLQGSVDGDYDGTQGEIKKYPGLQGRMNTSEQGVFVSLNTENGDKIFIEPVNNSLADARVTDEYMVHFANNSIQNNDIKNAVTPICQLKHDHEQFGERPIETYVQTVAQRKQSGVSDADLMVYRIAVSATKSYVDAHGGSKSSAISAIARTINRINQVFERDAGIRLQLVANNDRLIAPSNDPFSGSLEDMLSQNQAVIDKYIGSNNYDIGHLFTAHGGGLAYVGSACRANIKAMGVSGNLSVGSERFSLEFVAHEIAHQLGATHTFNSNQGLCASGNRNGATAYEPGSGSTIMSYFGICGSDNLQRAADDMFHIGSIKQISNQKLTNYAGGCGVKITSSNSAPEVDAGADYVIPANTPFELTGNATDRDFDSLLYSWQQQDAGLASKVDVDTGNNALFRSYLPNSSRQRSFPRMNLLLGTDLAAGETLPQTTRTMHFNFVAQDSAGATASDSMVVNVIANGSSFRLHTPPEFYTRGRQIKVTWDVADTHLPPVSCSSVNISLSTDNGLNFNQQLADNIANTGEALLSLPDTVTENSKARLKLSCSSSIFFAISPRPFGVAEKGTESLDIDSSVGTNSVAIVSVEAAQGGAGSFSKHFYWLMLLCLVFRGKRLAVPQLLPSYIKA